MDEMSNLLTQWGFKEFIPEFTDQEIGLEALQELTPTDLLPLIPKLGPRKVFLSRLENWRNLLKLSDLSESTIFELHESNDACEFLVRKLDTVQSTDPGAAASESSEKQSTSSSLHTFEGPLPVEFPALQEPKKCDRSVSNSISEYLKGDIEALVIQARYDAGTFDDKDRQNLSRIIIYKEMKGNPLTEISPQRFTDIAAEICAIFVGDEKLLYYIPRRKCGNTSVAPKGKLYNIYTNLVTSLIANHLRESRKRQTDSNEPEAIEEVEQDVSPELTWLLTGKENWTTVYDKWNNTSELRLSQLQNSVTTQRSKKRKTLIAQPGTVAAYIKKFPCLSLPNGYMLLELDFVHLYPGCELKLFSGWNRFAQTVCNLSNLCYDADLSPVKIFHAFAGLFSPTTVKGKGKGKSKNRSSKQEIVDGFLLHLTVIDELEPMIARLRQKAAESHDTLQPFPVVIGLTPESITDSYIVIDEVRYTVECPRKAVDVAFKSYHALHATYPLQSEGPWLLLQQALYGITTKWDKDIPRVIDLKRHFLI